MKEGDASVIKVALVLLALAVACGALLFASANSPKSPILHLVFIMSSFAFVVVAVIALVRRASTDTLDSLLGGLQDGEEQDQERGP